MKAAGIYIHIPFCKSKCNYCDYYSLEKRDSEIDVFVEMLHREIDLTAHEHDKDWNFDTIYFGGGSPALLPTKDVDDILGKLRKQFNTAKHVEVTLEINPDETTKGELLSFKDSGINRLSIGFQSLDPSLLHTLSRTHNPDDCFTIYNHARQAGFENINIDLMNNIPGQSIEDWLKHLKVVTDIKPDHITIYSLTIEKETPLFGKIKSGEITSIPKVIELDMFTQGNQFLMDSGFTQYEVSHFSKLGKECRHNQHYWSLDPYLAFGPSAHGYDGIKRWWNMSSLDDYISKLSTNVKPIGGFETLSSLN